MLISGGANRGRVGVITNRVRHQGAFDILAVKDSQGNQFNTRIDNCFTIGLGDKSMITLPRGNGVKMNQTAEQA